MTEGRPEEGPLPLSSRDYPEGEVVLGVELRLHSAKAAPVDTANGDFLRPGTSTAFGAHPDPEELLAGLQEVVRAQSWRGPLGISYTRAVWNLLGGDGHADRALAGALQGVVEDTAAVAPMIHSVAAGYAETAFGNARGKAGRVAVCTVGKAFGTVVYEDGERLRNLDVTHLTWKFELGMRKLQRRGGWEGVCPAIGEDPESIREPDVEWRDWCAVMDEFLAGIVAELEPDMLVLTPTGAAALYPGEVIRESLRATRATGEAIAPGFALAVGCKSRSTAGALVRGAAHGAKVELHSQGMARTVKKHLKAAIDPLADPTDAAVVRTAFRALLAADRAAGPGDGGGTEESAEEGAEEGAEGAAEGEGLISAADIRAFAVAVDLNVTGPECEGVIRSMCPKVGPNQRKGLVTFDNFREWWAATAEAAPVTDITSEAQLYAALNKQSAKGRPGLSVLQITADGCRACLKFKRDYRRLSQQYADVNFLSVNGDVSLAAAKLCGKLEIESTPAFVFYQGRERVDTYNGSSKERFLEVLGRFLFYRPHPPAAAAAEEDGGGGMSR